MESMDMASGTSGMDMSPTAASMAAMASSTASSGMGAMGMGMGNACKISVRNPTVKPRLLQHRRHRQRG